jgi:hypothetical protein
MGLETAGFAMAAIATGATIGKMSAEKEAEQANLSAINQQSKLLALQYQQKNIQNLEATDRILSRQAAQLSTRGVSFASPSFNAIQRETINAGSRKESNLKAEESLGQQGLDIERRNVKNTLHAQLFGDAASLAFGALDIYEKWPTGSGGSKKLPQVEDL